MEIDHNANGTLHGLSRNRVVDGFQRSQMLIDTGYEEDRRVNMQPPAKKNDPLKPTN